ncbi:type VI secretion system baseplate subunit TssF [Mesobaculum littorinae]|uniref:Type VI secretion system baseplate subunit TssF n=1 Tax=Mesobaculum littorinae TaxID=2486419 RepID=A0A438AHU9_9RHOB|nr:type VI secretion system baseplate subunit TssF [Mesobaculum littorinae]RVV98303.1 type VI secretion system baseplate subunit TssF [Mesobaculum littorinae]
MADRFLEHYSDELDALRRRAARFADAFPKIAGRLRLAPETSDDPHVERLIQSFAYSTARLRQKLDDGFPDLSEGLLETLYPHFLAPVPAMSVVSFDPALGTEELRCVPRGTQIVSDEIEGDTCRFRTTQEVTLAPVRIDAARLMARPVEAPPCPGQSPLGCLALTLRPTGRARIADLGLGTLRLYLGRAGRQAGALAHLLTQHATGVAVAAHAGDTAARHLPRTAVRPVGFAPEEAVLPAPERSLPGYRLLSEFFALPEKFLFVDIDVAAGGIAPEQTDRMDVYVYLDAAPGDLERRIGPEAFTLGATPVVNLFDTRAEPVILDASRSAWPLLADARRPLTRQVHSVTQVTIANDDGTTDAALPYFSRLADRRAGGMFYQLVRHGADGDDRPGATSVAFVDHRARPVSRTGGTASVEALATNGDLPRALPYGGGQPRLALSTPLDIVASVTALRPVTRPNRPAPEPDLIWKLISHMSLNHLSVDADGAEALRAILRLYDPGDSRETTQMIDAILDVSTAPAVTRIASVMVSGIDVTVTFDPDRIDDGTAHLFGSVLDRFLGSYVTLNTFTRLTLRLKARTDTLARFPARSGAEALI